ncbi:hypothetical protein G6F43_007442 [Rhizopus delemar]|nr:hypothetical protein G6F43_007442 [Rhizopus delemar]
MNNSVDAVLESKPAQIAFEKRKTGEFKQLYNAHVQNGVYQDKTALVDSTNIINNAGPSTSQQSPQPQPQPTNKKRATPKAKTSSRKKTKRLQAKDIKDLPLDQKVHALVGAFIALWQIEVLLNHEHKETWYQMYVYGDLLNSAFLFDKNYNIKRSECHASTINYLKKIKKIDNKEKDVKLDLILFNHSCGDMFTCEDKSESVSPGVVQEDFEKGNMLREKRLLYLQSIISYKSNIKHVEVLSAQFHGLTLTI